MKKYCVQQLSVQQHKFVRDIRLRHGGSGYETK